MTTFSQEHAWEESQVGVVESGGPDGRSGNIVRYWEDIGEHYNEGQSWCGAFQDAAAKATGLKLPGSMVSTQAGAAAYQRAKQWHSTPAPGDHVFFGWNRDGVIDHIGFVVAVQPTQLITIEGNTSNVDGPPASQRNGGCVAKRVRRRDVTVVGFGRPTYTPDKKPVAVVKHNPFNSADDLVRWTQWALGVPVDGKPGAATWTALRQFQARLHIVEPHYPGPLTHAALSIITHTT